MGKAADDRNRKYWGSRLDEIAQRRFNLTQKALDKELKIIYSKASKTIEKEVEALYYELLENGAIGTTDLYKYKRYTDLQNSINEQLAALGRAELDLINPALSQAFAETFGYTMDAITPANHSYTMINTATVEQLVNANWSGDHYSARIWNNKNKIAYNLKTTTENLVATLKAGITDSVVLGTNKDKLVKNVMQQFGKGFADADRVVRSELMHILNEGQRQAYKARGYHELEIIVAHDERLCPTCSAKDGDIISIDSLEIPPIHARCRCTTIPVLDSLLQEIEDINEQQAAPKNKPQETPVNAQQEGGAFTPANSIKEANKYATDVLGVPYANYKGVDVTVANEWNRGLLDNFTRYPELKKEFRFVGTIQERNKLGKKLDTAKILEGLIKNNPTWSISSLEKHAKKYANKIYKKIDSSWMAASWSHETIRGVTVSANYGDSVQFLKGLERMVENKFHPAGTNTIRSVLDHEIGHQLDDLLGISKDIEIKTLYSSLSTTQITEGLSEYAWKNGNKKKINEFVAEAYSEYCNNPQPREIAQLVGKKAEELYKLWKNN